MKFVLFEKLRGLEGAELTMLIVAAVLFIALLAVAIVYLGRRRKAAADTAQDAAAGAKSANVRSLVMGALCVSLSFILSYIKLFSMPMGGSVTLCSMLPITMYACFFGKRNGFIAAIAYGVLQVIQGAYIVHWAQFILDYFVAFACFGLAAFFPKKLPLGVAVAGFARMLISVLSGVIFFSEYAAEAGYQSALWYSLLYNGSTIGIDTVICVIVALLPPVARLLERLRPKAA